ncbi:MAG: SRPBCC domain-containing protein [Roseiflexaceae bacterium]
MDLSPEEQRRTVISSRSIDAPVDAVFDAYANSEKLVRWWGANGFMLTTESIDLNEGGHWRFVLRGLMAPHIRITWSSRKSSDRICLWLTI